MQAGNTLVGYTSYDEVKEAVSSKFDFDGTMKRIEEKVEDVEWLSFLFREQQTELGGDVRSADKQALQDKLTVLENELNEYLAGEYSVPPPTSQTIRIKQIETPRIPTLLIRHGFLRISLSTGLLHFTVFSRTVGLMSSSATPRMWNIARLRRPTR